MITSNGAIIVLSLLQGQNPSMLELDMVKISDHEEGLMGFSVNQ